MFFQMGVNNNFCNVANCNIFLQMNRVGRCECGCRLLLRCSGTTGQGDYFFREIHGVQNAGRTHKYSVADAVANRRKGMYHIGK